MDSAGTCGSQMERRAPEVSPYVCHPEPDLGWSYLWNALCPLQSPSATAPAEGAAAATAELYDLASCEPSACASDTGSASTGAFSEGSWLPLLEEGVASAPFVQGGTRPAPNEVGAGGDAASAGAVPRTAVAPRREVDRGQEDEEIRRGGGRGPCTIEPLRGKPALARCPPPPPPLHSDITFLAGYRFLSRGRAIPSKYSKSL